MNVKFWDEFRDCFVVTQNLWKQADRSKTDLRCVIVDGAGPMFSAGLDVMGALPLLSPERGDVGRIAFHLHKLIHEFQETFTAMEKCPVPVISVVHSGCLGAGVDLISATDIRICSKDASFCVKEVDIGLAADVGTLQRLPKVIGNDSLARELAFTGRTFSADEALKFGLVSHIAEDKEAALKYAYSIAKTIASKSPIAVHGTKQVLNFSRNHDIATGLEYVATWNAGMLQSSDLPEAASAVFNKTPANFSSL